MDTACNSMYFVRAAAVHTKSKKRKHLIWNTASEFTVSCTYTVTPVKSIFIYTGEFELGKLMLNYVY